MIGAFVAVSTGFAWLALIVTLVGLFSLALAMLITWAGRGFR